MRRLAFGKRGDFVAKTFDKSLMAINYARAASADFNAIQAAFARRLLAQDHATTAMLDAKIAGLEKDLGDDLSVAVERSQSERATKAGSNVQRAVAAWRQRRSGLIAGVNQTEAWRDLDRYAAVVEQQIELLVNYTAGDGFSYRQKAHAAVALATRINLVATLVAIVFSGLIAWLLARTILGPIGKASEVAAQIAGGQLDVSIPSGAADELGALLAAMEIMRESIRSNLESEVAQRRSAQTRLADALESSREGIIVLDAESKVVLVNSQAGAFLVNVVGPLHVGDRAQDLMAAIWAKLGGPGVRGPRHAGHARDAGSRRALVARQPERDAGRRRDHRVQRHLRREGAGIRADRDQQALRCRPCQHVARALPV